MNNDVQFAGKPTMVLCVNGPRAGRIYYWFDHVREFSVSTPDVENPFNPRYVAHIYDIKYVVWGTGVKLAYHRETR